MFTPLPSPKELKSQLPLPEAGSRFIAQARRAALNIVSGDDERLAVVVGPCSIHDTAALLEYGEGLKTLADRTPSLFLVLRAYAEKPRTTTGWKGLLYDPHLNGSCDMATGLVWTRKLLLELTAMGLPLATEFVDPLAAPYIDDLITWGFVGARTAASQPHRQLVSALPFPCGFKNSTDGDLLSAVQGILAARIPHTFFAIDSKGHIASRSSSGNTSAHLVLRGSDKTANADRDSVAAALSQLCKTGMQQRLMIDCSHGNAQGNYLQQKTVFQDVVEQILEGNHSIFAIMLESHINGGSQPLPHLNYGVSITDPCLDWPSTASLLSWAEEALSSSSTRITSNQS